MLFQDAFDDDLDLGTRALAQDPVDDDALVNLGDQRGGDDFQLLVKTTTSWRGCHTCRGHESPRS